MSPVSRYRHPSDLPSTIPVFPLRGAILLPRATMPLNVFEPISRHDRTLPERRPAGRHHPTQG